MTNPGFEMEELKKFEKDVIWLKTHFDEFSKDSRYVNKFVAVKNGSVIAFGDNLKKLVQKMKKERIDISSVVIEFVPAKIHASMYKKSR